MYKTVIVDFIDLVGHKHEKFSYKRKIFQKNYMKNFETLWKLFLYVSLYLQMCWSWENFFTRNTIFTK